MSAADEMNPKQIATIIDGYINSYRDKPFAYYWTALLEASEGVIRAVRHADENARFREAWDEENARWKAMNNDTANQDHTDPIEAVVGEDGQAPAKLDRS